MRCLPTVFQFQNIPVGRRIEATNDGFENTNYRDSEMRAYLVPTGAEGSGAFLAGLTATAGVPQDVLWGPVRHVANKAKDPDGTY